MRHSSEAPAPPRGNADAAGNEVSTRPSVGQTGPLGDNALSHIRNVAQIIELAAEWSRHLTPGDVRLQRHDVAEITNRLAAAVLELQATVPAPIDPSQIQIGGIYPMPGVQLTLGDATGAE